MLTFTWRITRTLTSTTPDSGPAVAPLAWPFFARRLGPAPEVTPTYPLAWPFLARRLGPFGGITPTYPLGLPEAIGDLVEASSAIVGSGLAVWADSKPRGEPNPALIVKCPSGVLWISDDISDVLTVRPTTTVMASTKAQADSLGELVIRELRGATLAYGDEGEIKTYPLVLQGRKRARDEAETINGEPVFRDVAEWYAREIRPR